MSGRRLALEARQWRDSQQSIGKWRAGVDPRTFAGYYSQFYPFLQKLKMPPDEFAVWAKTSANEDAALDAIKAYVLTIRRRHATMQLAHASIRSFLIHNRVVLPRDATLNIRATLPPVERQLTIPQIHGLVGLSVQPWRSMILMKWGSLSDNQGLTDINRNHADTLVKALQEKADICKLTMPGRKKKRNSEGFYTFAHPEALASLREYFEKERGWPKKGEPVWTYETKLHHGKPVKTRGFEEAWLRLLKHAKLIPAERSHDPGNRYGFGVHNTRDLAISELCTVPGFNIMVADFMAGHEIDPLKYKEFYKTKPQYVEEQYRIAIPHLNLLSNPLGAAVAIEAQKRIEEVEIKNKLLEDRLAKLEAISVERLTLAKAASQKKRKNE